MKEPTPRQQEVLHFITSFTELNSCPPTVRETAEHFSISVKAVQDHFTALRKKGYIAPSEGRSRSLKVLIDDPEFKKPYRVPVLGTVAAGLPIFCDENYDGSVYVPASLIHKDGDYFALYVSGDSMINAGILDGDLALIRRQENASNGSIVVAFIEEDEKVTLKRFFKEPARIRLQAENEAYGPIYCQNVRILGILSNIIRNY